MHLDELRLEEREAIFEMAGIAKALEDPTRLEIVIYLLDHKEEVEYADIVKLFTLEQPTVSHHVRILRDARIVRKIQSSYWSQYSFYNDAVRRAMAQHIETLRSLHKVL